MPKRHVLLRRRSPCRAEKQPQTVEHNYQRAAFMTYHTEGRGNFLKQREGHEHDNDAERYDEILATVQAYLSCQNAEAGIALE